MPNLTLSIPPELKERMDKHPEINWSQVARGGIQRMLDDLEFLDRMTVTSELTEADAIRLGRDLKKRVARHTKGAAIAARPAASSIIRSNRHAPAMQRSTTQAPPLELKVREALESFLGRLRPQDRARLRRVVVFGSAARGEATPESDVDLLVVWDGPLREALDRLVAASTDVFLATGVDLSVHIVEPPAFDAMARMRTAFFQNLEREGIVVAG